MPGSTAQEAVTVRVFAHRFPATRRGAAHARRLAARRLGLWGFPPGHPDSDAVCLVVAELAANAVLHGRVPGRGAALRLAWDAGAGSVRVEVSDTHPRRPAAAPEPPADAEGGRGLLLVSAVAASWGVADRAGPGKTVWAELAVNGASSATPFVGS
ncbi:ATP-binding protein [Streptomyces genisteinicus]|uniref:ATP-binding protein n=1 Tax=Streptomyces genisteinicus TaxID=2768068 RepID=A0A7H0HQ23_9ACTN|nr:ATP-binding protein [Streptomyces genisteinicus]QNP62639.1 ATP-binding protein [Streptomyces genisteinicus]